VNLPSKQVDYRFEIKRIDKEIQGYEQIATYMKKKSSQLNQLDTKGFEEEVAEIKKYLQDLNSHSKVDSLLRNLNKKIRDYNKRFEIAQRQLSDFPRNLIRNDISEIERLLSNPMSISQAEDRIKQIKQNINNRIRTCFPMELTQYTDTYLIGNGGFARVYKAKNIVNNQIVAVKIPIRDDPSIGKSFMRELKNWVGLKHNNIVEVFNYNVLPVPYFEMELCDSCLGDLEKPLDPNTAIEYVLEISDGLKYAHQKKIAHLDLKPQNILLKEDVPKISDWGMSKLITEQGTTTIGLSLPFAAPEQFSSKFGEKDEQTDIWQLGVLFYNLITGKIPFSGKDFAEYGENITSKDITTIENCELTTDIMDIILKCLAKNKKDRYKTINHLQKDLKKL